MNNSQSDQINQSQQQPPSNPSNKDNYVAKKFNLLWNWLVENFRLKNVWKLLSVAAILYGAIKAREMYNHTIPISDALLKLSQKEFKKVTIYLLLKWE